jgi:hypothetical protein
MEGGKMKRIASAVLMLFVLLAVTSLVYGQASVPNLVNFQGRLLNNLGSPVADGNYGVTFRLFDAPAAGTLVWAETSLVSTSSGVFTHQLGADNPFSVTLFQDYDSQFLEIVVGGETITPRTRLTSAPYTRLAGGIEVPGNIGDPETLSVGTNQFHAHSIKTFGSDGQEQFRVWGDGWGEIYLYDQSVTNDRTVVLSATGNSGGQFSLNQEDGTSGMFLRGGTTSVGATLTMRDFDGITTVSLDADAIGNSAALLPTSSVSAVEMYDEPGIATEYGPGFFSLTNTTANQTVDSVIITVPGPGKVVVEATGYVNFTHTNGTTENIGVNVSTNPLEGVFTYGVSSFVIPAEAPTATGIYAHRQPFACRRLFNAPSAGSMKFYLFVQQFSGSNIGATDLAYSVLHATYYPTAYGSTPVAVASAVTSVDGSSTTTKATGSWEGSTYETAEEFQSYVEERYRKEIAELEARIQKLEKQFNQTGPSQGVDQ